MFTASKPFLPTDHLGRKQEVLIVRTILLNKAGKKRIESKYNKSIKIQMM